MEAWRGSMKKTHVLRAKGRLPWGGPGHRLGLLRPWLDGARSRWELRIEGDLMLDVGG